MWAPPVRLGALRLTTLDFAAIAAAVVVAVAFARGATDAASLAGENGTGAILLLLPGLVVFIAAVVAARALGFLPRLLERAGRGGPLSVRLAALSLARNPGRAAIAVAFLVVSLGLALFAAVYRSTLTQGQRDQAAYAVPSAAIVSEDTAKLVRVNQAAPFDTYQRYGPAAQVIRLAEDVPAGAGFSCSRSPPSPWRPSEGGARASRPGRGPSSRGESHPPAGRTPFRPARAGEADAPADGERARARAGCDRDP